MNSLRLIVSGGQTGVDRAALDVAIFLGIEHGGWCPLGRRAEDGEIPLDYQLRETRSRDYADRTQRNVQDSDGTLILYSGKLTGGTAFTASLARKKGRSLKTVDLALSDGRLVVEAAEVREWITTNSIAVLNVAGHRESGSPGIHVRAVKFLMETLEPWFHSGEET